jgi:hypothetical protein
VPSFFCSDKFAYSLVGTDEMLGATIQEAEANILSKFPHHEWKN